MYKKLLTVLMVCFFLVGCSNKAADTKSPITLTMWHSYGGKMQTAVSSLIDEFNTTVGKEKGIHINVTSVSNSSDLNDSLNAVADGRVGAADMPDICSVYSNMASRFVNTDSAAELSQYFTREELAEYVDIFVEEGTINGGLYVFPVAKSTEVLYVNKMLFDEFVNETGVDKNKLETFEGIAELSGEYYKWTDAKTPDIQGDGKAFFVPDSWVNIAMAGSRQLGWSFVSDETFNMDTETYKYIWNCFYGPVTEGAVAVCESGYAADLCKTGEAICSTGSSATILFYGDTITYEDNTTDKAEYLILPYPHFKEGKKIAIQRGSGLMVAKSTPERERAAVEFIKWLTETERNMTFAGQTGFLPVKWEAYDKQLLSDSAYVKDEKMKKLFNGINAMYSQGYKFFYLPSFEGYTELFNRYDTRLTNFYTNKRRDYTQGVVYSQEAALEEFKASFKAGERH